MFKAEKEIDKYGREQTHYWLTQGDSCTITAKPFKNGETVDVDSVSKCIFKLASSSYTKEFEKELTRASDHFVLKLTHEETSSFAVSSHLYEIEYLMNDGDVQTPHSWKFDIINQIPD